MPVLIQSGPPFRVWRIREHRISLTEMNPGHFLIIALSILSFFLPNMVLAEDDMTQRIKLAASNPDMQQSVSQLEDLVRQADANSDINFRVYFGALGRAHLARSYRGVGRWKDCADTMAVSIAGYTSETVTKWFKSAEQLADSLRVEHYHCLAGAGQIDLAITELTRLQTKGVPKANESLQDVQVFQRQKANSARLDEVRTQAAKRAEDAEVRGNKTEALGIYTAAMQAVLPNFDTNLALKAAELAKRMKSLPPVPEEARRYAVYGQTALKAAKDNKGYQEAAQQLSHAVALAPWWRDACLNLGLTFELMGDNLSALNMVKAYAALAPPVEAKKVQDKIYELEYKTKQAAR
jgi:tetratricopeptide (TPR) repeat protein